MKIDCYNFFFHPLDLSHSTTAKALAVITAVALTAISLGTYLLVFAFVRWNEKSANMAPSSSVMQQAVQPVLPQRHGLSPKLRHLKEKQADHLVKLKKLPWQHLQTHTTHPDSGFDWWMFPIDRPSAGQGDKYQVSKTDIAVLKEDSEFIKSYREGVILVAKSWGWDLEVDRDVSNGEQKWTNYQVRLGKMLHSLILFGQDDLHESLVKCIDCAGLRPSLAPWIQKYL